MIDEHVLCTLLKYWVSYTVVVVVCGRRIGVVQQRLVGYCDMTCAENAHIMQSLILNDIARLLLLTYESKSEYNLTVNQIYYSCCNTVSMQAVRTRAIDISFHGRGVQSQKEGNPA